MNKIIFTADDYGVVPSVNEGIIDMVNKGLINSVEVLTNYKKSVQNTLDLIRRTDGAKFEIGVHLTITSGEPLTNNEGLNPIIDNIGSFKKFSATNSSANLKALREELEAQVNVLLSNDEIKSRVTHITCHHDSLWFFPGYTEQFELVSKKFNFPIRNPRSFPHIRNKMYYTVILPILRTFSFSFKDIDLIRNTYNLRKKRKFPGRSLSYLSTKYMDSRHYGPIPIIAIRPSKKTKHIKKKQKKFKKMLKKGIKIVGNKDALIEFMFHLRKGSLVGGHEAFRKEMKALDYEGINPHYFDSRTIEYETLRLHERKIKALLNTEFEMGSWKDATLQTLKKK